MSQSRNAVIVVSGSSIQVASNAAILIVVLPATVRVVQVNDDLVVMQDA